MDEVRLIDATAAAKKFKPGECYYGEILESEDMVGFLESEDFTPTIDPEKLPIVRELRDEIARLNRGIENLSENIRAAFQNRDELREKLVRYEQAEQAGRLVIVPDKLFEVIYDEAAPELFYIVEHKTEGVAFKCCGDYIEPSEIGVNVFDTREFTELAMADMKAGKRPWLI